MDRDQYVAAHLGSNEVFGPSHYVYDVVKIPAPHVVLILSAVVTSHGDTGWEAVVWNVMQVDGDRLDRLDVYLESDPSDPESYRRALERVGALAERSDS